MTGTVSGRGLERVEGPLKVTGRARYAAEYAVDDLLYAWPVQATVARGRLEAIDRSAAEQDPEIVTVLGYDNAPRLGDAGDAELEVLQSPVIAYRGQVVGLVVARSLESARDGASRIQVRARSEPADVLLRRDHPRAYRPEKVNPDLPALTEEGDPDAALASAPVSIDHWYATPAYHNNPMEPHASIASFTEDGLLVYDSNQGADPVRDALATLFGLAPEAVRVIAPHVGGGFGSKGTPRPIVVLAALASKATGRPVKLVCPRQAMFAITGYRTPTMQRVRLGAQQDGRLLAIVHEVVEQTSRVREFAEQTATATRTMYAAAACRTDHHLVALDMPTPSWMRAPGECPGMYALESAMDELAVALGMDPIELRRRNEPELDPDTGEPYTSRNLIACLDEGARRFGWDGDRTPGTRRQGRWLVGSGVAASTYPARTRPSKASLRYEGEGKFIIRLAASDIGTGARTALSAIAADCLGVGSDSVRLELGDSAFPDAPLAGGSAGTASWGSAVAAACREARRRITAGEERFQLEVDTTDELERLPAGARHAFGAQFVEVRVDPGTGEVRVPRMVGVFAAGRIVNPPTARSQFLGGMTMGLSMALMEESILDVATGVYVNRDLADYHVAVFGDVGAIDVSWIDEHDEQVNPIGVKGIGEIGIVGTAAAVANGLWHATGVRIRELPLRPDRVLSELCRDGRGGSQVGDELGA